MVLVTGAPGPVNASVAVVEPELRDPPINKDDELLVDVCVIGLVSMEDEDEDEDGSLLVVFAT